MLFASILRRCSTWTVAALLSAALVPAQAQRVDAVASLAAKEQPALLDTLKALCEIESGSADIEGLDRIAALIAGRLRALGGRVELIEPSDIYKMFDTPEKIGKTVRATFTGRGQRKILLLAHMDTVYPRGLLAQQPFRIDGDKVYGLAIADDKQGVAVILHTLAILKAMNVDDYGTLTVLINGDEEISSPGSRALISRTAGEHDVVLSYEGGSLGEADALRLATSGIGAATLRVQGRASHAGAAPERGVNALYELAHQVLQASNLSNPAQGLHVNWTLARAGLVRNMIPPGAEASADVRVDRLEDYDGVERSLRELIEKKRLPEARVELIFERRRPPLQATEASRKVGAHAQKVFAEIGGKLQVRDKPTGGGTDAAFAFLGTKAPVLEGFGLRGYGAHSTTAEYVMIDSIQPRLYLSARMIIDLAQGKVSW